ncbi:MAG: hypothetical protein O3A92_15130 [Verrucomicrobia bacterium]|nr:hypothetical protein [Verrucomicrobiota bacterium]
MEAPPWTVVQWFEENVPEPERSDLDPPAVKLPSGCALARDQDGQWVVLLPPAIWSRACTTGMSPDVPELGGEEEVSFGREGAFRKTGSRKGGKIEIL